MLRGLHFRCNRQDIAAYVILAITLDGRKDVISLQIGENESSKYWLGVLNELKNRGVKDVMIICADGLTGMKEAIGTAFPDTGYHGNQSTLMP